MNNFNWKSLSLQDLEWVYKDFPFKKTRPYRHQLIGMAFAANEKRIGFWMDVGVGKTLTAYWSAMQWGCHKILVVCPGSAISAWVRDAKKTNYSYEIISGETSERKAKILQRQCVSILQYESLKTVFAKLGKTLGYTILKGNLTAEDASELVKEDDRRKVILDKENPGKYLVVKEKSRSWKIDETSFIHFDCIIFDEIHRCNNYSALQSEICLELSKRAKFTVGLSGTPVDRCLLELFNIYRVLDLGKTFGWNFLGFRSSYFTKWGFDWQIKSKEQKDRLLEKWATSSLSFDRKECFDLPECQEEVLLLQPTKEFQDLEMKVIGGIPLEVLGLSAIFVQASTKVIKLKQLTDGFLYFNEDRNNRVAYRLKENPKLEAVLELFDCGKKMIVFHRFEEVGDILCEALQKQGTRYIRLKGGLKPEERSELERQFQEDPEVLGAVVQEAAGAEGWDGFSAEVVVFWDIISSPKIRKQCIGRMLRSGQTKATLVIELVLEKSINEVTKKNQGSRKTEVEEYMEYIQGK